MTVSKFSIRLKIGFLNMYPPIIFFQHCSNFSRYIRTILRFTKAENKEAEVRKQTNLFVPARNLSTLLCEFFIKTCPEYLKFLRFLSLKWGAYSKRIRLVRNVDHSTTFFHV